MTCILTFTFSYLEKNIRSYWIIIKVIMIFALSFCTYAEVNSGSSNGMGQGSVPLTRDPVIKLIKNNK